LVTQNSSLPGKLQKKSGQWNFRLVVLVDERFEKQREWSGF
jgi:hypothetical protein